MPINGKLKTIHKCQLEKRVREILTRLLNVLVAKFHIRTALSDIVRVIILGFIFFRGIQREISHHEQSSRFSRYLQEHCQSYNSHKVI